MSAGVRVAPTATPWLWRLRRRTEAVPAERADTAVILPHAGGSASAFLDWVDHFPPGLQILAAQYPGRGPRMGEPSAQEMEQLVGPLAQQLGDLPGRLVLIGHSLGAIVGLEVARALATTPKPVDALVVSSARAPTAPTLFGSLEQVPAGPDLIASLRRWGGLPDVIMGHEELLELVLGAVRDDLCLLERYATARPTAPGHQPLGCPLIVVAGRNDPLVPEEHLADWLACTTGPTTVRLVSGGHFHADHDLDTLGELIRSLTSSPSATATPGAPEDHLV